MGIRTTLQKNQPLAMGLSIAVIAIACWVLYGQVRDPNGHIDFNASYFSADDGKTWFEDTRTKLTPFDHGGQPAVRAVIFKCPSGTAVAYLERHTAQAKQAMEEFDRDRAAGRQPKNLALVMGADRDGKEVKRPGDAKWVNISDPAARAIMAAVCPDGSEPEAIVP